jgi:hypothetical protein
LGKEIRQRRGNPAFLKGPSHKKGIVIKQAGQRLFAAYVE